MRYLIYLLVSFAMQIVAWLVTPVLPLFAVHRMGWSDNHRHESFEPRLPLWLSWFDTPDNSLYGDDNWYESHGVGYWGKVAWLYRNSLYGFKWTVLSAAIERGDLYRKISGDHSFIYGIKPYGWMYIKQSNGAWQWKCVVASEIFPDHRWLLNFGWLLDDVSQPRALFMFSPRIKKLPK